ncbi:MAG: DNA alkylation repair protein [Cetobacterium sp.]|uniref:DNA alkylation repair protein n=1 Tax=Cetobacterium sp. TaxID=2071632 RepID=UPI003F403766
MNKIILIETELFKLKDEKYKDFHKNLIPNVKEDTLLGIRVPILRQFSKKLYKENPKLAEDFLKKLPHKYYEENNLHSFIIGNIKDFQEVMTLIEEFLPYVDNWGVCDSLAPKILKKYPKETYEKIKFWLNSPHPYTVRFAIGLLLSNYLDKEFHEEMLDLVSKIKSDKYYINMMIAWYFATALAKQYESTIPYIQNKILSPWVHNKTIQKSIESKRISPDIKIYLKTLKVSTKSKN